ncbi:MAG: class I SAM-dependent methyltransferase [Erysipelotrichaceae bacterium]|nr:class I SAM-dependent methyltransferase [Erysipelotrichaceae bacterium]
MRLHPTITELSHMLMNLYVTGDSVCVDGTVGGGNDTVWLCEHARYVYGFDIQKEAIDITGSRLYGYNNYELIEDSHENMERYVKEPVDCVIFNFGYLPGANHEITTKTESSLRAVEAALRLLKSDGHLILCFYPGHEEGKREYENVVKRLSELPVLCSSYRTHIENSPVLYLVTKK